MSEEGGRLRAARRGVVAFAAVAIPAALIAGTWSRHEPIPDRHREPGVNVNLYGTPIARPDDPRPGRGDAAPESR